jgi:FdhD protein
MGKIADMPARQAESSADQPIEYKTSGEHRTVKVTPSDSAPSARTLANEVPVALEFDGEPYAVMMLTPGDFEDFAVGFALSERIVANASDIARIDVRQGTRGIGVDVRLEKEHRARLLERRRALPGQSGCGICGLTTIEEALPQLEPLAACPPVASSAIFSALQALPARQVLNKATGAVHAAAFCRPNGDIVGVREDVGRHNALDKVIGHLLREGIDPKGGFALLTSRCSYELVQKAVLARIPMLATISAPTELAVSMAGDANLTLVSLARTDSVLIFNDPFGAIAKPLK